MTTMTSWDLFEDLRSAQDELLRMNRAPSQWLSPAGYFGQRLDSSASTQAWAPALDISERKDAYLVTVELPGVKTEDVEIMVEDGLLSARQIDEKLARAWEARLSWRRVPVQERASIVRRAGDVLEQRKQDYGRLMTLEMGKTLKSAIEGLLA